jgi:IS5 family transposase
MIEDETLRGLVEQIEHLKASIRATVEHPLRVIKRQFGYEGALPRSG